MKQSLCRTSLLSSLLAFAAAQHLHAKANCTDRDFKGVYGMLASGVILVAPPPFTPLLGPVVRVGRVESDGKGNVALRNTASYNGFITTEPYGGKYTVTSDCAIAFDVSVPLPIIMPPPAPPVFVPVPFQFKGALADGGADVAIMILQPPGAAVRIHLRREHHDQAPCATKDLSGAFQVDMFGSITAQPPNPPGPFTREGRLVFDGRGGFSGDTIASYAGSAGPETLSGSYSIDAACNITMHPAVGGQSYTWLGTLTDRSNGADLIVADPPGAVVAGTLKQQKRLAGRIGQR